MKVYALVGALGAAALATACASQPENVQARFVSPTQYDQYDCDQIRTDLRRVSARVSEVADRQQDAANRDAVATGVGLVLFWPALFFLAAGDHEEELGRLKGEYEALQTAANEKKCDISEEMRIAQAKEEQVKQARGSDIGSSQDPAPKFN